MAVTDPESSRLSIELRAANEKLVETELVNRRLRNQLRASRANEERLRLELRTMRRSLSWRITYPLRIALRVIRRKKF